MLACLPLYCHIDQTPETLFVTSNPRQANFRTCPPVISGTRHTHQLPVHVGFHSHCSVEPLFLSATSKPDAYGVKNASSSTALMVNNMAGFSLFVDVTRSVKSPKLPKNAVT